MEGQLNHVALRSQFPQYEPQLMLVLRGYTLGLEGFLPDTRMCTRGRDLDTVSHTNRGSEAVFAIPSTSREAAVSGGQLNILHCETALHIGTYVQMWSNISLATSFLFVSTSRFGESFSTASLVAS